MKKRIPAIFTLFLLISTFSSFAQDKVISENELPYSIREYIATHFKNDRIIKCEKGLKGTAVSYDVKLNEIKLEFNSNNQVKEISSKSDIKLPDSVIPPAILTYVKKQYPGIGIIKWELKKKKQEVKLDNHLDLEFSLDGKFLRIDD